MQLSFSEMESVFSRRFELPVPTIAFRARLQHLQRSHFPTGVNTGKGKRAVYGWRQLLQLSVALDLIEAGFTPDVAKGLVLVESRDIFDAASALAANLSIAELVRAATTGRLPLLKRPFVLTSAKALSSLGELPDEVVLLSIVPATAFFGQMRAGNPRASAGTFIDLGARLLSMLESVSAVAKQELGTVVADLKEWATQHAVNP